MRYDFFRFSEVAMKHIAGNFFLGAGYKLQQHWNVVYRGPQDGAASDYQAYGAAAHPTSSGLSLNALVDSRDNSVNASNGFYAAVQYYNYEKALGSNNNWQSLIIDVRKYYRLPENSENVIAFWSYNWLTLSGKPPYLDLPSTSWDTYSTTGRGYIQSRFRGAQMVYLETEYRFKISRNGLIGGVVFLNGESFSAAQGTKLESIQPGYGPGLRIKLSKVSQTNLAIDYGFGNQGSRGLFLTVGEVF
jgi:outer membrane protein assembly factor BamA